MNKDSPAAAAAAALALALRVIPARAGPLTIAPEAMPSIATVDERYPPYNIEMAEVVGGEFWKPYGKRDEDERKVRSGTAAPNSSGQGSAMFEARPPIVMIGVYGT